MRVLLLGATGTIGLATARALLSSGHAFACVHVYEYQRPVREFTDIGNDRVGQRHGHCAHLHAFKCQARGGKWMGICHEMLSGN